jgi:hypothetical protein
MKVLNLTDTTPNLPGLENVDNRARLAGILSIPEEALRASESSLSALLEARVQTLIKEFVLPAILSRVEEDLEFIAANWAYSPANTDLVNRVQGMTLRINVLVGGDPLLMERLIPALRRVGAVPHYALPGRFRECA